MDLKILKKMIDGYRAANGSIKNVPPELLLELRQTWEHYTGTPEEFRSEIGVKTGTLRKLWSNQRSSIMSLQVQEQWDWYRRTQRGARRLVKSIFKVQ